jgi:predicted nucleotidyltransferase component of viral defense system
MAERAASRARPDPVAADSRRRQPRPAQTRGLSERQQPDLASSTRTASNGFTPRSRTTARADLERLGSFAVIEHEEHTLNGQFHETKVQFLHAAKQTRLEPTTEIAGIQVAGLSDILAMKLKVIADRGELRDYFDIMRMDASPAAHRPHHLS